MRPPRDPTGTIGRMDDSRRVTPGRLRRLADELDYAMRPPRHERRVASYGSLVFPTQPVDVGEARTGLKAIVNQVTERADDEVRRYADGLSSWDGMGWHVEPPTSMWLEKAALSSTKTEVIGTINALLRFAVHYLGASHIGAMFVIEPSDWKATAFERRLPTPPPLSVHRAQALGPLGRSLEP